MFYFFPFVENPFRLGYRLMAGALAAIVTLVALIWLVVSLVTASWWWPFSATDPINPIERELVARGFTNPVLTTVDTANGYEAWYVGYGRCRERVVYDRETGQFTTHQRGTGTQLTNVSKAWLDADKAYETCRTPFTARAR